MELYTGVDLHSNNNYTVIMNEKGKRVHKEKIPNNLDEVLFALEPYQEEIKGVVIESTYNWYWLCDGLMENGYKVHLANPSAIKQYEGLKHSDDYRDALHLANLLRLGILPEGYIYPKEERPVRDLLRKRLMLVKHRTAHILSFKGLVTRTLGINIATNEIKKLKEEDVEDILKEKHLVLAGKANIGVIRYLKEKITEIEKAVMEVATLRAEYEKLLTVPGIGKILALTIMLETGEINRFSKVGNYTSYCRLVNSKRLSNGKNKGEGNRKNGNKYLCWAYVEAANHAIRGYPYVRRYYQKKMSKTSDVIAKKALAHKISRACYYIIKDQEVFNPEKIFGTIKR